MSSAATAPAVGRTRLTRGWAIEEAVAGCCGAVAALVAAPAAGIAGALVCAYAGGATPTLVRIDLDEHRLPDRIVLPGCAAAAVGLAVLASQGRGAPLAASVVVFAVFAALTLVAGMGFGDAKLAALLAGALAPAGAGASALMVVVAFVAGGVAAVVVLVRRGPGTELAFGPWLLAGYWTALLWFG